MTSIIFGDTTDIENNPLSGSKITLDMYGGPYINAQGGVVYNGPRRQYTDANGNATFTNVTPATYKVTTTDAGYNNQSSYVANAAEIYYIDVPETYGLTLSASTLILSALPTPSTSGSYYAISSSYALTAGSIAGVSGSSVLYLQCNDGNTYQISLYKYNGNIFLDINQNPIIGNNGFINIGNVNVSDVTGMWSNPNGNIVPNNINNAATYYQDPAYSGTPTVWLWSVTNQAWFQLLG
jgi:hypothetical protein